MVQEDSKDLGGNESSEVRWARLTAGAPPAPTNGGFLARFGSVRPRNRPEDWAQVRAETAKEVGRDAARLDG